MASLFSTHNAFKLILGIVVFAPQTAATDATAPSPCPTNFATISRWAGLPTLKTRVGPARNAVEREYPHIADRNSFAENMNRIRLIWNQSNPHDIDGFPMPAQKGAIDYIKKKLIDLRKPESYRDEVAQRLSSTKREAQIQKYLTEINELEHRDYPYKDTLAFIDKTAAYFDFINHHITHRFDSRDFAAVEWSPGSFEQIYGVSMELTQQDKQRLNRLANAITYPAQNGSQKPVFDPQLYRDYDDAVLELVQKNLDKDTKSTPARNARQILRTYESSLSHLEPKQPGVLEPHANGLKPLIVVVPEVTSVRALVEATLFRIHTAGIVTPGAHADRVPYTTIGFLDHDRGHIRQTIRDPIARQLMDLSVSKKQRILDQIDQIQDPEQREIAEITLLGALREGWGRHDWNDDVRSVSLFSPNHFDLIKDRIPSKEEQNWTMKWWTTNISPHLKGVFPE